MIKIIIDTLLKSRGFTEYRNKKKSDGFLGISIRFMSFFFVRKTPKSRYKIESIQVEKQQDT